MESGLLPLSFRSSVLLCAEQHTEPQGAGEVSSGDKPVLLPVKTGMCIFRTRHDTPQAPITLLRSAQLT